MRTGKEIIEIFESLYLPPNIFYDNGEQYLSDNICKRKNSNGDNEYYIDIFNKEIIDEDYETLGNKVYQELYDILGKFDSHCTGHNYSCEMIVHFLDDNIYIKMDGWYSSYDGYTFNGRFKECVPKEKTIITYEYIK